MGLLFIMSKVKTPLCVRRCMCLYIVSLHNALRYEAGPAITQQGSSNAGPLWISPDVRYTFLRSDVIVHWSWHWRFCLVTSWIHSTRKAASLHGLFLPPLWPRFTPRIHLAWWIQYWYIPSFLPVLHRTRWIRHDWTCCWTIFRFLGRGFVYAPTHPFTIPTQASPVSHP